MQFVVSSQGGVLRNSYDSAAHFNETCSQVKVEISLSRIRRLYEEDQNLGS